MKTVGIISEYNPFHNGHEYHIRAAKEACGASYALCIMSGNFVQRGEPAIFDKWSRAHMAIKGGADLVIELPSVYACQPAEIFALGAVKILNSTGIVDYICFGSESGETEILRQLAELLHNEPESLKQLFKSQISRGISYPKAISKALYSYVEEKEKFRCDDIMRNPNNLLGIEYIKALTALKSKMEPIAVKRIGSGYNDVHIEGSFAGATAIRNEIKENGISEKVRISIPKSSLDIINSNFRRKRHPIYLNDFSDILLYKLRITEESELRRYLNVREGLENRLKKYAKSSSDCNELIETVKTKRYTRVYIQRLLCHILLDMRKSDIAQFKKPGCPSYVRVLAFNDSGKKLLKEIKACSSYPVISKAADFSYDDEHTSKMFNYDILSTDIYNLAYNMPAYRKASEDYFTSPYYHK